MRKEILTACPLLFIIAVMTYFGKPPDCTQYKFGKFYIYNKTSGERINIERKDSLQVETNAATGDITVMKVSWKNECEYELFFNYATPKEVSKAKRSVPVAETSADIPFHIKILSGTDNYYLFEASKQGLKRLRDTVWLVKVDIRGFTP